MAERLASQYAGSRVTCGDAEILAIACIEHVDRDLMGAETTQDART